MKMFNTLIVLLFIVSATLTTFAQTNDCFTANPFCTSNQYEFPNATSGTAPSGPSYGCLLTRPRPIWYYMEIDQSGTINIALKQTTQPGGAGNQIDVDFAIWGPFSDLNAGCQQIMSGNAYPLQCSYSPSYSETIGLGLQGGTGSGQSTPPAAQVGEVYIVLLTNYNGSSGYISFNQVGGTGSADCNIIDPCAVTNFTANVGSCSPNTGVYNINGSIDIVNPPATGQLIVENCEGNQTIVATAPFNVGSYSYTLAGLTANGAACDIRAYFTEDLDCSALINYSAPQCAGCSITDITANVGACQGNGTYDITGSVSFSNAPATGTLEITNTCGGSQIFTAPFTSPLNYSIAGVSADGSICTIKAVFSDLPDCQIVTNVVGPTFITPYFDPIAVCQGDTPPILPTTSTEGLSGTWVPSVTSTATPGQHVYIFTPDSGQCAGNSPFQLTVNALPDVVMPATEVLYECLTSPTVNLNGSTSIANPSFEWTGNSFLSGQNTNTAVVNATGWYTLTVTDVTTGCFNADSIEVIGDGNEPQISIDPVIPISCDNPTLTLNAVSSTPGATFVWLNNPGFVSGQTTLNPVVGQAGTYQIDVTGPNGCTNSAAVVVTGDTDMPNVSTIPYPLEINCPNPTVIIAGTSSTPNVSYSWTGPNIISGQGTDVITAGQAGTYTVTVTDNTNNCTSTASYTVIGDTIAPTVTINTPQILDCVNTEITLTGSSNATTPVVSWAGPSVVAGDNTFTPTVNAAGTYTITVVNADNQCVNSASVTVNEILPVATEIFAQRELCATSFQIPANEIVANGNVTWTSAPGGTFSNPNIIDPIFTADPGVTDYRLVFTDECGLTDTTYLRLVPAPQITAPDISCNMAEYAIQVQSLFGGYWTIYENPSTPYLEDTTLTFDYGDTLVGGTEGVGVFVSHEGTYRLTFHTNDVCPDTSIELNFPPYVWTVIDDTILCQNVVYELNSWDSPYPVNYLWSTGATTPSIQVDSPGMYVLTVSNECHTYSDTANIAYKFCDIEAPNIISLSSQAGNNLWFVTSDGVTEFNCIIVNRWGNVIYEYNDVYGAWDGRDMKGNLVSEGVYFYTITGKIAGGEEVTKQGFIHVVH